ncbi:unnamed protein product, partial [Symbiodinium pilosum]
MTVKSMLLSQYQYGCRYLDEFPGYREVFEMEGNFVGGIIFPGSGWFQVFSLRRCKELIDEEELFRGHRYRHVVLSRFDNMWLEPHPLIPDRLGCWIPWYRGGNDWGGLNDHHAWCDRHSAEIYMSGRYSSVVDAAERRELREWYESCGKFTYPGSLNVEKHIRYILEKAGIPVYRFHGGPFRSCAATSNSAGPGKSCRYEEELGMLGKSSGTQLLDVLERHRQKKPEGVRWPILALNRVDGGQYPHHPAFREFPCQPWPVTEKFVFDWTGLRWPKSICRSDVVVHQSDHWKAEREVWKLVCQLHIAHLRSGLQLAQPPLPPVDAGYFLAIAIAEAVLRSDGPFVMGTFGARLGHLAARAAKLLNRRARSSQLFVAEGAVGEEWFCELLPQVFLEDLQKVDLRCGQTSVAAFLEWLEEQAHVDLVLLSASHASSLREWRETLMTRADTVAILDVKHE